MKVVTAALILDQGKVLIACRASGEHAGFWEFPGGKLEPNESPEDCLFREIQEELSITIKIDEHFYDSIYDYGRGVLCLKSYLCRWLDGDIKLQDHQSVEWVEAGNLLSYNLLAADIPIAEKLINHVQNSQTT